MSHVEQAAHGFAAIGSIVEGALVYVHADEPVGQLGVEIAGELHGVGQRFVAMIEGILNALFDCRSDTRRHLRPEAAANGVASQRQRQPGNLVPPLA